MAAIVIGFVSWWGFPMIGGPIALVLARRARRQQADPSEEMLIQWAMGMGIATTVLGALFMPFIIATIWMMVFG